MLVTKFYVNRGIPQSIKKECTFSSMFDKLHWQKQTCSIDFTGADASSIFENNSKLFINVHGEVWPWLQRSSVMIKTLTIITSISI